MNEGAFVFNFFFILHVETQKINCTADVHMMQLTFAYSSGPSAIMLQLLVNLNKGSA